MKIIKTILCFFIITLFAYPANAEKYEFSIVSVSDTSNTFWQGIQKGMDAACDMINSWGQDEVDCILVYNQENGNVPMELETVETIVRQGTDGLAVHIVNDDMFDDIMAECISGGQICLATNVDDSEGSAGNARLSMTGQDLYRAGYELVKGLAPQFPDGDVHILFGLSAPGQSWAEARINGGIKYMEEYKAENSDRNVTWDKIDSGMDTSLTGQRVCSYIQGAPETTAYFDAGFWGAGAGTCLRDLGYKPGELLMGMFDIVEIVLDEMRQGYVHLTVDQQPFYQGFLPILQMYFMNKFFDLLNLYPYLNQFYPK
jgi:simple sugar transport system substrate-binding protein